jgi:hypothetical protein
LTEAVKATDEHRFAVLLFFMGNFVLLIFIMAQPHGQSSGTTTLPEYAPASGRFFQYGS